MTETVLDVQWSQQGNDYFCGPAVAEMYLRFAIKIAGTTAPVPTQAKLWELIKMKSPSKRPAGAPAGVPSYKKQHCDDCGVDQATGKTIWRCWSTSPAGLRVAIDGYAPPTYGVEEQYPSTFDAGINLLMAALDGNPKLPAIATKYAINHWVIVNGYRRDQTDDPNLPAVQAGTYQLNGVYIQDPLETDAVARVRLITAAAWRSDYGIISCGLNAGNYPTVVADHAPAVLTKAWPWWVLGATVVASGWALWRTYFDKK